MFFHAGIHYHYCSPLLLEVLFPSNHLEWSVLGKLSGLIGCLILDPVMFIKLSFISHWKVSQGDLCLH